MTEKEVQFLLQDYQSLLVQINFQGMNTHVCTADSLQQKSGNLCLTIKFTLSYS